jgi:hypothetical protein
MSAGDEPNAFKLKGSPLIVVSMAIEDPNSIPISLQVIAAAALCGAHRK